MKKVFVVLLILSLLLVGCGKKEAPAKESEKPAEEKPAAEAPVEEGGLKDGTYHVVSRGHSEGLELDVTFKDGKIGEVKVASHGETEGISDLALEEIPKLIVEHNSINIDAISGATETSEGIIAGVKTAIEEAGGKVEDFQTAVEVKKEGETIEHTTQVVVVGGGIAGLSAALEAHNNGAKVMLVEKMPICGGSTMVSGGKILAAESPIQKELGIEDNWKDFADYLYTVSEEQGDRAFIDYIAEHSGDNIQWLMDNGVEFSKELEPLHSTKSPIRGHYAANNVGAGITDPLVKKLESLNVPILVSTEVTELLENEGKVIGVRGVDMKGNDVIIHADKVILSTGGFNKNEEMMKEFHPYLKRYTTNGSAGNVGDGIRMAEALGAKTLYHDSAIDLGLNYPTYYGYGEEVKGLFVTPDGKRFMDESLFHFTRTRILMDLGENVCYYITDEYNDRVEQALQIGTGFTADSIEALAEKVEGEKDNFGVGLDGAGLKDSFNRYNELCAAGNDEDFGKDPQFMKEISGDKLYALRFDMSNSGTIGGLVVTLDGEVLNKEDKPIEGLYAVGELASGQYFYKEYPGSGSAICAFLALGRRVGEHVATSLGN